MQKSITKPRIKFCRIKVKLKIGEAQPQTSESEEELLERAKTLAGKGQWKGAAIIIEKGLIPSKFSAKLKETVAFYHSKAGDFFKAISIFDELCKLYPTEAKWHFYLGFLFQQKKLWNGTCK